MGWKLSAICMDFTRSHDASCLAGDWICLHKAKDIECMLSDDDSAIVFYCITNQ